MSRKLVLWTLIGLFLVVTASPVFAQEAEMGQWTAGVYQWALIAAAGGLAVAAALGTYSQSRAVTAACEAIARNPSTAPQIRFALILGLALIESLVIYVFVISLVIMFVRWGTLAL